MSRSLRCRNALLGRDSDRLVQRTDRRRVDVLHRREVVERQAGLDGDPEEVGSLLDAFAAHHLGPDETQGAGFGNELHPHLLHARVVAGPGDAVGDPDDVRHAEGISRDLTERHATDHPLAGDHAPGDIDGVVSS